MMYNNIYEGKFSMKQVQQRKLLEVRRSGIEMNLYYYTHLCFSPETKKEIDEYVDTHCLHSTLF